LPAQERRLRISVSRPGGGVARLEVRDSGAGIPVEALEKVFDAFWTTKSSGMGIGLAVCKTIVEASRGRIWAERNPDRGATCVVILQLAPEAGGSGEHAASEKAALSV